MRLFSLFPVVLAVVMMPFSPALISPALAQKDASRPEVVHIYSTSKEHLIRPVLQRFEHETGIEARVSTLDSAALTQRLLLEGEDTLADAVIVADMANVWALHEKELLQGFASETIERNIPPILRDAGNHWVGIAMRARLIFHRKGDEEAAQVDSYLDLADPRWDDGVLVRSSHSVYNQSLVADLIYRHGREAVLNWAEAVVANMARPPQGGDRDQLRALASGQGRLALANSYYYALMLTGEDETDRAYADKLVPVFPDATDSQGPHINIRAAAVTKHARHREAAQALVAFLTTPEAQRYLALNNYEYPANPDVKPSGVLQSWGHIPKPHVPLETIGRYRNEAIGLLGEAGWQ